MKILTEIKPLIDKEIEKHIPRKGTPQVDRKTHSQKRNSSSTFRWLLEVFRLWW